MKTLTDAMLQADAGTSALSLVFVIVIILVLVEVVLIRLYLLKRNKKQRFYIVITLLGIVFTMALGPSIYQHFSNMDWYVSKTKIKGLHIERSVGEAGTNHYRYIVKVEDAEVLVSKNLYASLTLDENVYVLNSQDGTPIKIYPQDSYRYDGLRLKN